MEKIKLSNPIKIDGVEVNEISLRRPKVRDLLISDRKNISEAERRVNLIANLAEIPVESVEAIDLQDFMKINNWLKDFLAQPNQQN